MKMLVVDGMSILTFIDSSLLYKVWNIKFYFSSFSHKFMFTNLMPMIFD